jgi:hypothetical protein
MAELTQYVFIRRAAASSTLFGIDPTLPEWKCTTMQKEFSDGE